MNKKDIVRLSEEKHSILKEVIKIYLYSTQLTFST